MMIHSPMDLDYCTRSLTTSHDLTQQGFMQHFHFHLTYHAVFAMLQCLKCVSIQQTRLGVAMNLGGSTVFETIACIGASVLHYAIVFLAAVKCVYKVSEAICYHTSLLSQTDICSLFYHP